MDRLIQKKKWTWKKILAIILMILFLSFAILSFIFNDSRSTLNVAAERLTIATITSDEFQEFIPIIGNVLPIMTVYLDAIEGGRVEQRYIEAGTLVNAGDPILKLANTSLLLDIMFREAEFFQQSNNLRTTRLLMEQNRLTLLGQLNQIEFQLKKQKRNYERNLELSQKSLISQQDFEQIETEYQYLVKQRELSMEGFKQDSLFRQIQIEQLEASLRRMGANLEIVKQKLESLTIKAPIGGLLSSLNAEIGESKSPGERLGQIDVVDSFKVRAGCDEYYISRVEIGRTGLFDLDNKTFSLKVTKVYPEVREGRFELDLIFVTGTPIGIRRGQTLHIRLNLGDLRRAVLLPRGGFYQKTGGQWIYVLDKSKKYASKRSIKLGQQNTQVYEVLEGLVPGEQVITSGYDSFGDKEKLILK